MKNSQRRNIRVLEFLLAVNLLIGLMLTGCTQANREVQSPPPEPTHINPTGSGTEAASPLPQTQTPIESKPSAPSTPITVKLILSKAPRLNEPAELTFIISSIENAAATKAAITLPEGTVLVSGNLTWSGDLAANKPETIQAKILFNTEGNKTLTGNALSDQGGGNVWGDAAYIYLHITQAAGFVGFPTQPPGQSTTIKPTPPSTNP